jgi:WD40 repeat protein
MNGTWLHTLEGYPIVAFSPLGERLVCRCSDYTLQLWNVATGQCQAVLSVSSVALHIDWIETVEGIYMAEGRRDGSVAMWNVHVDGEEYRVRLLWRATNGRLNLQETVIQDVRGLSILNKQLHKQRGAVGNPVDLFHETGKS